MALPETGDTVQVPLKGTSQDENRRYDVKGTFKTAISPTMSGAERRSAWRDRIPLRVTKVQSISASRKPPLTDIIPIYFTEPKFPYVNSVLHYLQKSDNIQWDEEWDLYSPLNRYNILDIVQSFLGRKKVEKEQLQDYEYIIRTAGIPYWLIKNKLLVNQLRNTSGIKKGAGKRHGKGDRNSSRNISWLPY